MRTKSTGVAQTGFAEARGNWLGRFRFLPELLFCAFTLAACQPAVDGSSTRGSQSSEGAIATKSSPLLDSPGVACADHAWNLLTTGYSSACARGPMGAKCWGVWATFLQDGTYGGAYVTYPESPDVLNVGGSTDVRVAASGWFHTCVAVDNQVFCFGDDSSGQLGNGSDLSSATPVPVSADFGSTVVALSSKAETTCALLQTGDVWCWGNNGSFVAGEADPQVVIQRTPVQIDLGGQTAKSLAVGANFACVVTDAGEVRCWGDNGTGQLGGANLRASAIPVLIPTGDKRASFVSASHQTACAVFEDQTTACWGLNDYGQAGLGNTLTPAAVATVDALHSDAGAPVQIDGGSRHFCASYADGSLKCWGKNNCWDVSGVDRPASFGGQLGLGVTDSAMRPAPTDVPLAGRMVTAVKAGIDNTCASFDDGSVKCWGCNFVPMEDGELSLPADATNEVVNYTNTPSRLNPLALGDAGTCPVIANSNIDVQIDWVMAPHFPGTEQLAKPSAADQQSTCAPGSTGTCRLSGCNAIGIHVCIPTSETSGVWSGCHGYEVCNGLDDDCDGRVDDEGVCQLPHSLLASGLEPNYFPGVLTTTLPDQSRGSGPPNSSCDPPTPNGMVFKKFSCDNGRDCHWFASPPGYEAWVEVRPCPNPGPSLSSPIPAPGSAEAQPDLAALPPADTTCNGTRDANGVCRLGTHPGYEDLSLGSYADWAAEAQWTCPSYGTEYEGITLQNCRAGDGTPGCHVLTANGWSDCHPDPNMTWGYHCTPGRNSLCKLPGTNPNAPGFRIGSQTCKPNYTFTECTPIERLPFGFDTQLRACGTTSDNAPIDHYIWNVDRKDTTITFTTKSCQADFVFPTEGTYDVTVTAVATDGSDTTRTQPVTIKNHVIAALGDSISSGEGNPDVPYVPTSPNATPVCDASGCHPPPGTVGWVDQRCHRSMLGFQALAARDLETMSLHDSVSFIHLGCSGAQAEHIYQHDYKGQEPDGVTEGAQMEVLANILTAYGERTVAPEGEPPPPPPPPPRPLDALLLQVGANDFGFHGKVVLCAIPTLTPGKLTELLAADEAGLQTQEHEVCLAATINFSLAATCLAIKGTLDGIRHLEEGILLDQAYSAAVSSGNDDTTSCAGPSLLTNTLLIPPNYLNSLQRSFFPDTLIPGTALFDKDADDPNLNYTAASPAKSNIYRVLWNKLQDRLGNRTPTGSSVLPPTSRIYIAEYPDPTNFEAPPPFAPIVLSGAISDQLVPMLPSNKFKSWLGQVAFAGLDWDGFATLSLIGNDGVVSSDEAAFAHSSIVPQLNTAVRDAAHAFGWTVVTGMNDDAGQFGVHGYSAADGVRGFRHYDESKVLEGTIDGTIHPNVIGHGIYRSYLEPLLVHDLMGP